MSLPVCSSIEVCIFRIEKGLPRYLLLRRAETERLYPGIWQFVTGSILAGENAVDAAYRELREETGLEPAAFWVVPFVNSFYDPAADSVNLSPLFAAQVPVGDSPEISDEHSEFGWFSREGAARKLVWPGQRTGLQLVHDCIVRGEEAAHLTRIR